MAAKMIKIPGVGPVKSTWVYAGVGVTAGILIWAYWRRSQAAAAEGSAAPSAAATAEGATDPYSQYSDAAGYNMVYPSAYSGQQYSPYGYDIYGNPLPAPTGASGTGGAYTTNQAWAEAAESALQDAGITLATSTLAISRVLGGLTVTSAQRDLFLQAIGLLGQPPQGYPQPIKLVDTPGQPAPGPPKPPSGKSLKAPARLRVVNKGQTWIELDWDRVTGAAGYAVYVVKDSAGGSTPTGVRQRGSVLYDQYTAKGLARNTSYRFDVHAVGADNQIGARARIYAKTAK